MLEQVVAAFDRRDYKTAAQLLRQLVKESPNNPWVKFYVGRLQEVSDKPEAAERTYRSLLQETNNPKLIAQARQGLERLAAAQQAKRKQAIAEAANDPANAGTGFLVLEPISPEQRQAVIPSFAKLTQLDAYTARIHLSHRAWRLYRSGTLGELRVFAQELHTAGIPAFWAAMEQIRKIRVFRVQYFESASTQPTVVCLNESEQAGSLSFDWTEVKQRVEGLLPIFEDVVDLGPWNKLKRKEATQDYAQILDLHLPGRNSILRFCDRTYQFQQGVEFDPYPAEDAPPAQSTTRIRWNTLATFLQTRLPEIPIWSDFTPFADTALNTVELFQEIKPHIGLFRKEPTPWDPAFHLYSSMVFLKP